MNTEITIRPLQSVDVDSAFSAWAAAVEDGGSFPRVPPARLADFEDVWIRGASSTQVAFLAEELAGVYFVAPNFTGPCAHIAKGGYVVPAHLRRQGIGRQLVEHSLLEARRLGFDSMMFNLVMETNPSRKLYEQIGFVAVGRVPRAIGVEDAYIYWRSL